MSWDVLSVGANSVDLVHLLPAFPQPEGWHSKLRISRRLVSCGGQAATTAATCASFGLRAKYVGVTGTDEHGALVRAALSGRRVDIADVIVRDAPNQFAVILLDEQSGERAVLWDRDDRLHLREDEFPYEALTSTRLLHVDDVDQEAAIRLAWCGREQGLIVTSDLDRHTERTADLIGAVTVPVFADGLPQAVTGLGNLQEALRALRQPHHSLIVATIGQAGAVAIEGDRWIVSPGFRVEAVDTTGAGDVFRGGLIRGLLEGWPSERCLEFANAAAATACTRRGVLDSVPSLDAAEGTLRRGR
jgi:sugar/nucleoside kinase (ribokinase family)